MAKKIIVAYSLLTPPENEGEDIDDSCVTYGVENEVTVGSVRDAVRVLQENNCVENYGRMDRYESVDPEIDIWSGEQKMYQCKLVGFTDKQLSAIDILMGSNLRR